MEWEKCDFWVKRGLYERIVVPTVLYGFESLGTTVEERNKLDEAEMNCLQSMCGVTRWGRWWNEVVWERVDVPESLSKRVDGKALKWFGHVEQMGSEPLTEMVCMSEMRGERGRGVPTFRWMGGIRKACAERRMGLQGANGVFRDLNVWRIITDRII